MATSPSDEEMAAILAAYQALQRPVVVPMADAAVPPAWRFSGRWWSRPVATRRIRPG
jgi:hypothetical protein